MDVDPKNFFIGVIDFFAILLPGAILSYELKADLGPNLFGSDYATLSEVEGWAIFLFSSYLFGHLVFLLGSGLLDKWHGLIRDAGYEGQIKKLARGDARSCWLNRLLAFGLFKKGTDKAVDHAERIKEHYLDQLQASSGINAFQWCKARLTLKHPEAIATVQRFEADSKFFRSLVVVLFILLLLGLRKDQLTLAAISLPLLVLAFWRYVDQRTKATTRPTGTSSPWRAARRARFDRPRPLPHHPISHPMPVASSLSGSAISWCFC